ncbi:MAG: hypothetical protein KDC35_02490 [Acidobacteria bacterium]|nr:hypothetical protein [Acidobacteriota bacterium]
MKKYVLLVAMIGLTNSCVVLPPPIYAHHLKSKGSYPVAQKVGVIVLDQGHRDGYKNSFEDAYGDRAGYCEAIGQIVTQHMTQFVPAEFIMVDEDVAMRLASALQEGRFDTHAIGAELNSLHQNIDQFLIVTRWDIGKNNRTQPSGFTNQNGMPSTTTISVCSVRLKGGLFGRQGEVLEYGSSIRERDVNMFGFATALQEATILSGTTLVDLFMRRLAPQNISNQTGRPYDQAYGHEPSLDDLGLDD